jgi:uncharacterized membrane protein YeaQ/YmgE (transglycosylase-associated protein family)
VREGYFKNFSFNEPKPVSIEAFQFGALGKCINVYIWCAIGALAGWLSTRMMDAPARSAQIENILIGMFGAFIGGDFVAAQLNGGVVATEFQIASLGLAIAGAVVMLVLLRLMRKAVGPLKKSRSNQKKRN